MRVLIVATVVFAAACSPYEYRERKVGNQTELVRVHKLTGKTEVMVRTASGGYWTPINSARPAAAPTPTRVLQRLPPDQKQLVQLAVTLDESGTTLLVKIVNGSAWSVEYVDIEVDDGRDFWHPITTRPREFYGELRPGDGAVVRARLPFTAYDDDVSWRFMSARGYLPK